MQGPNRMGLGMRPAGYGQGPPIGSLPPGGMGYAPARPAPSPVGGGDKLTTVFVGSISGGVTNEFLTSLFAVSVSNVHGARIASHSFITEDTLPHRPADRFVRSREILLPMGNCKDSVSSNSKNQMQWLGRSSYSMVK